MRKLFYDIDKKIKQDLKYHTCVTHLVKSIVMPKFLWFSFELTSIQDDNNDVSQYTNLLKYKSIIKNYIVEKFSFNNYNYYFY